jgi:dTDP-4-dehydrorhamnose 3,5-epimerase
MKIIETKIEDLKIIEVDVYEDKRGFFMESYNKKKFFDNGIDIEFVQDNHSRSSKNILRGLHFQKPPFAQDKLVRVTSGKVLDVAVDIRENSPTFGQYEKIILSAENKRQFLVPKGFAHGFAVLSDTADFLYKVSNYYNKESEGSIIWNDSDINIDWEITDPILSEKDKQNPKLKDLNFYF